MNLWPMKNNKESMLLHYSKWEQSGLNKREYNTHENMSYQAFCKFCSRQKESIGFALIKPETSSGQ